VTIRSLLIANRGEIACRVLTTCRRLGIESVLGASEADRDSLPARLADRVVVIGPPPAAESYLDVDAVVAAALAAGVEAIHPGYGFLAENPELARRCSEAGMIFIGPTTAQLADLGDKVRARELAAAAGLPLVPGRPVPDAAAALTFAGEVGYPVVLKATAGGGGKGMTRIDAGSQLAEAFPLAQSEARAAFGDDRLYVERFIANGRHVEVQVLGDGTDVVHFGDRDCSIQRRYQKLIEEAPAPNLDDGLRQRIHAAAVRFARHCDYQGLGTVEFLVDADAGHFYFLEMNARIQVEHPITEAISGVDLVAEQIAVAGGQPLGLTQGEITLTGHAIECRINAEDPSRGFLPCPGRLTRAVFPAGDGVRVDTHAEAGASVPPHYDSLVAKIVARGRDRPESLNAMRAALDRCQIEGIVTNLPLHRSILADAGFAAGGVGVRWLEGHLRERHG
jgi:acetyl-CoA carboxylase, biotin carboxylase subunit